MSAAPPASTPPEPSRPDTPPKPDEAAAAKAKAKAVGWSFVAWLAGLLPRTAAYVKPVLLHALYFALAGLLYLWLLLDGLREMKESLNVPMYKAIPLLSFMRNYQETRGLLMAHFAAMMLLLFCTIAWESFFWLTDRPGEPSIRRQAGITACLIFMVGEPVIFWKGLYRSEQSAVDATLFAFVLTAMVAISSLKLSTLWPRKETP